MKRTLLILTGTAIAATSSSANTTPHDLSSGTFSQNWSVDLITATNDWSGVPSIIGYRGDGLASSGTDPQAVVSDGSSTPVDAINNSSSSSSSGGIHDLSGDVVALQGSGTADAPHLVIHLNATGRENLQVSYNLTEEDTSNAIQQVALQYRIGGSGDYTNVAAGYVADASNGSSLTTPVSAVLPAAVDGQALVEVRIITADASGSDSMIGIDDIVITSDAAGPPPASTAQNSLYQAIDMGVGSGEVVSHAKVGSDFFIAVTDNPNGGVSVFKWIDANQKYQYQFSIDAASAVTNFKTVSSVALDPRGTGLGALVAQVDDPAINTTGDYSIPQLGRIIFFDVTDGSIEGQAGTGHHPDMVAISSTGIVAVANEGEYAWDTAENDDVSGSNQNGSVSLYDLSAVTVGDFTAAASATEVNVDFTSATLTGVRYGTAEEIEPEYVAFDATGDAMFVGAQENNTVFRLDGLAAFIASPGVPAWEVHPLGAVQYTADVTNEDGVANINTLIKGLHTPAAIAVFDPGRNTYVVTADEGDARPDDSDITRARTYDDNLSEIAATPIYDDGGGAVTQQELFDLVGDVNLLGRLNILVDQSTVGGAGAELTDIVAMGSRGISVWQYDDAGPSLTRVSHLSLESYLLAQDPTRHNSNDGGDPDALDARSDDKGPEPEAVAIANIGGTNYAVVGCERQNGVVLVDLSDPAAPSAVSYINNRDNGLISPETAQFIPAAASPTGAALAICGFEGISDDGVEGGIGIYTLEAADAFTLTLLHNNDGESDLSFYSDSLTDYGNIGRFKSAMDAHVSFYENMGHGVVKVFAGDSFLAGKEFQASLDAVPQTFYDALAISRIGYDAVAIGNHEFDFGPDTLAAFIADAQTTNPSTYLSCNLDFSAEANLQALATSGEIASSKVVEVPTASGMKKVGIIGATTENLPFISSPGGVVANAVAASVNAEIATLQGMGDVDTIVLVSHLQGISEDIDLIPLLSAGIDLIVAGGGDELLGDTTADSPRDVYGPAAPGSVADTGLIPGDSFFDVDDVTSGSQNEYPYVSASLDLGGNSIPIVTSAGSYGYLGRITLSFDGLGGVTVDSTSNPAIIVADTLDATNGYPIDSDVQSETIDPVEAYVANLAATVIGNADALMVGGGSSTPIRSNEQAVGNLVADAYLAKAQALAPSFGVDVPQIAMPNGGGIRADIAAGDISLATTFNVSPFGNFLAVVEDVTTADLKLLLENCYSKTVDTDGTNGVTPTRTGDGTGRFAQVAGMKVVYDISKTALVLGDDVIDTPGVRVVSATLDDDTKLIVAGEPVAGVTVDIAMPAFSAAGGDQWFRYASNGTVYYTSVQYPYTALGATDQQALADYIIALDGTVDGTGPAIDSDSRYDSTRDGRVLAISDRDSDGLLDQVEEELGTDPDVNELDPATQLAALAAKEAADVQTGQDNVTNDPAAFDLYTETSILDLRMNGVMGAVTNPGAGGTAVLDIDVYRTADLGAPFPAGWTLETTEQVTVPAPADKQFYRLNADQP